MFERFRRDARHTVIDAQEHARDLGADTIQPAHLLLSLIEQDSAPAAVLRDNGLTSRAVREGVLGLDPAALRAVGVDLDEVTRTAEESFGPGALLRTPGPRRKGHIPFTKGAKAALEGALKEAIEAGTKNIGSGHILLGLLREEDPQVRRLLQSAGTDPATLRSRVAATLSDD